MAQLHRPLFNVTDPQELRRLVRWYSGIADDYRKAAAEAENTAKASELEARKKSEYYHTQLRKLGQP